MCIDDDLPTIPDVQPIVSPKSDEISKGMIEKTFVVFILIIFL